MAGLVLKQSLSQQFGEATTAEVEQLVSIHQNNSSSGLELLPQGAAFLLAGLVQQAGGLPQFNLDTSMPEVLVRYTNASAIARSLVPRSGTTSLSATAGMQAFAQRLLQVPEAELHFLTTPGSNDIAALRFLCKAMQQNMSSKDLARALHGDPEGLQCLEAFRNSPTLGSVVMYASIFSWWDGVLDWLEGAAQWVKDAYQEFGEWATKQANAVVDAVFSKYASATHLLENIPGVGLVVAGIYAIAGKSDEAWAAVALNVNAIVSLIGAGIGFWLGGVPGAMIGGAMGKAVGLLLQEAIASLIKDPTLKAEVGDISAARFIIEVALAGAAGSAGYIGTTLASELGMNAVVTFGLSQTLAALLAKIPSHFAVKYAPTGHATISDPFAKIYTGPGPVRFEPARSHR